MKRRDLFKTTLGMLIMSKSLGASEVSTAPLTLISNEQEMAVLEDLLKVEIIEINLGIDLICLAETKQGGELIDHIQGVRKRIVRDYGFFIPPVRIRDDIGLNENEYSILLKGIEIGKGKLYPDRFMAFRKDDTKVEVDVLLKRNLVLDLMWYGSTLTKKQRLKVAAITL